MKKYKISIPVTAKIEWDVVADDIEDAKRIAIEHVDPSFSRENGDLDNEMLDEMRLLEVGWDSTIEEEDVEIISESELSNEEKLFWDQLS